MLDKRMVGKWAILSLVLGLMTVGGCDFIIVPPEPDEYVLVVDVEGQGDVLVSPTGSTFTAGERIDLRAVPKKGWVFDRWKGDVTSTSSEITIQMDSDRSVTAVFKEIPADEVLLKVIPVGGGVVTLTPAGKERLNGYIFERGETVTLKAIAEEGFEFVGWFDDDGTKLALDAQIDLVLVDDETTVIAKFDEIEPEPMDLTDAKIFAQDDEFLGIVSADPFAAKSLANPFGIYGDEYSELSIWNPYGDYGSYYSDYSAYDPYAHKPPKIFLNDELVGYLTKNDDFSPRFDPDDLAAAIGRFEQIRE